MTLIFILFWPFSMCIPTLSVQCRIRQVSLYLYDYWQFICKSFFIKARSAWRQGEIKKAREKSSISKDFIRASVCLGMIVYILILVVILSILIFNVHSWCTYWGYILYCLQERKTCILFKYDFYLKTSIIIIGIRNRRGGVLHLFFSKKDMISISTQSYIVPTALYTCRSST